MPDRPNASRMKLLAEATSTAPCSASHRLHPYCRACKEIATRCRQESQIQRVRTRQEVERARFSRSKPCWQLGAVSRAFLATVRSLWSTSTLEPAVPGPGFVDGRLRNLHTAHASFYSFSTPVILFHNCLSPQKIQFRRNSQAELDLMWSFTTYQIVSGQLKASVSASSASRLQCRFRLVVVHALFTSR